MSFRGGTDRGSLEDLSFISLLPRSTIQDYIKTISKNHRAVLVGPSKSGKTFVATKLAEYFVLTSGEELTPHSVAMLSTHKGRVHEGGRFDVNCQLSSMINDIYERLRP